MSKTPSKDVNNLNYFIPKDLSTPTKDNNGVSKTIFTHLSHMQSLLNDWNKIQSKGSKICKSISSLRLHKCKDDYFPHELKSLMDTLLQVSESLEGILEGTEVLNKQMQALAKLNTTTIPIFYTWTASQIADSVSKIHESLKKELKLKQTIIENIAHCRDEHLIEVYVSSFEFNVYLNMETSAYLFVEVGLTGVT